MSDNDRREHHVRIRYVVTCDQCGDIGEVETIGEGTALADEHEAENRGSSGTS